VWFLIQFLSQGGAFTGREWYIRNRPRKARKGVKLTNPACLWCPGAMSSASSRMATRVLMRASPSPIGYMILVLLVLQSFRFRAALVRVALGMVAEAGLGAAVAREDWAAMEGKDTLRPTRPSLHH
jgi:hypothetical protein